jgi:hypothetical protein
MFSEYPSFSMTTSQKLYVSTKMSVMKHIFAPLLLRCKEPPMHKQHCRLLIDTMKSLSPAALTLKPLRRPSNRSSPQQHCIRLCSHIVHVVYRRTWYVCRVERKKKLTFPLAEHVEFRLNEHRNSISGILCSHIVFMLIYRF